MKGILKEIIIEQSIRSEFKEKILEQIQQSIRSTFKEKTPEQIQQSIRSAFDSVNLINSTILLTMNNEHNKLVGCNLGHLRIMLEKPWFDGGLTSTEKKEINTSITNGYKETILTSSKLVKEIIDGIMYKDDDVTTEKPTEKEIKQQLKIIKYNMDYVKNNEKYLEGVVLDENESDFINFSKSETVSTFLENGKSNWDNYGGGKKMENLQV